MYCTKRIWWHWWYRPIRAIFAHFYITFLFERLVKRVKISFCFTKVLELLENRLNEKGFISIYLFVICLNAIRSSMWFNVVILAYETDYLQHNYLKSLFCQNQPYQIMHGTKLQLWKTVIAQFLITQSIC